MARAYYIKDKSFSIKIVDLLDSLIEDCNEEEVEEIIEYFGWNEKLREKIVTQLSDEVSLNNYDCFYNQEREQFLDKLKDKVIIYKASCISNKVQDLELIERKYKELLKRVNEFNKHKPLEDQIATYPQEKLDFTFSSQIKKDIETILRASEV